MGRKKALGASAGTQNSRPFCYYCDRTFEDETVLIQHQRAKHFRCSECADAIRGKCESVQGLIVHTLKVHGGALSRVPNAVQGRDDPELNVYGMDGIPDHVMTEKGHDIPVQADEPDAQKSKTEPAPPPMPAAPGLPGSFPGFPGFPGLPAPPGMATMPGLPGYPGLPGFPGLPAPGAAPAMPAMPGFSGMGGMPGFPGLPFPGTMPGVQEMPGFPGMPMPSLPGMPPLPSGFAAPAPTPPLPAASPAAPPLPALPAAPAPPAAVATPAANGLQARATVAANVQGEMQGMIAPPPDTINGEDESVEEKRARLQRYRTKFVW